MLNDTRSPLTYKKTICNLRRMNYDWQGYDRHYRMEHEENPIPWHVTRQNLMLQYQTSQFRPTTTKVSTSHFGPKQNTTGKATSEQRRATSSLVATASPSIHEINTVTQGPHVHTNINVRDAVPTTLSTPVKRAIPSQNQTTVENNSTEAFSSIVTPVDYNMLEYHLKNINYDPKITNYLVDGFKHGFRIDHNIQPWDVQAQNSPSINNHQDQVKRKIEGQVSAARVAGPFTHPPWTPFQSSPLNIREKRVPGTYRLIHDLSYPYNECSVNANIPQHLKSVKYSSVMDAVNILSDMPRGSYMAKTDIADAYRIIPLHPSEYPKLGFMFNGNFYFDKNLPQGCASSCRICECFSIAIQAIFQFEIPDTKCVHIIDDFFIMADTEEKCHEHLQAFLNICKDLGVPMAPEKKHNTCNNYHLFRHRIGHTESTGKIVN